MSDETHLRAAIALAVESVSRGGGPFGAVVVRDGEVLAQGANRVVLDSDPTAHAEIVALRGAARTLGTHDLTGCVVYTSSCPCPMCYGALHWARVTRVVHAASYEDAARAGFDDELLLRELRRPATERTLPLARLLPDEGLAPFAAWKAAEGRIPY